VRDWVDDIFNAATGTPTGQFAVVVRTGGRTERRGNYASKRVALAQATRQAGESSNGYVVQNTGRKLIIWLSADTTLRTREAP
jgi:hypothetical protein